MQELCHIFATLAPTMAQNELDQQRRQQNGLLSNVFSFVSREIESFVATATGGEPSAKVSTSIQVLPLITEHAEHMYHNSAASPSSIELTRQTRPKC